MANTTAGTDVTMTQSANDGQLLSNVAEFCGGSELRFAELVRRHGPMVLSACRRQLGNHADAEDAAQAVFLLLWQRARRLRNRASVAGWLHHAARNICRNALRTRTVRNEHERNAAGARDEAMGHQRQWDQIKDLLDDELDHLPEKYRLPMVLFHLEGRSLEEIGVLLHLKESTVGTRLTRGRDRLRQRLQRRGIALSAAAMALLISQNAGHAALPLFFAEKTARAACRLAMGRLVTGELVSTHAVALSKGAMKMQTMAKVKSVAAVVIFLATAVAGVGMVIARTETESETRLENASTPQKKDKHGQKNRDMGKNAIAAYLHKLDGMWRLVSLEIGGKPVDPETWGRNVRRQFSGTTVHFHSGQRVTKSEIRIDPSKMPKWMDETWVTGARTHGIYELKGNTLRLFMVPAAEQRPTKFKTRPGTKEAIATYERVNPAVEKNGLSVSLVARQQTFIEGEDLRFMATFKNVSDKDFRIYARPWYRAWELTIDDGDGSWQVVSLIKAKHQPAVFVYKAGHAQGHEVRIADNYFVYRRRGPQKKPMPPRDHLKPGKYKLHAVMKFIKNGTPGAPSWTGTIKPPPVAFEIVADPIPARLRQVEWGKETNGLVAKFRAVKNVVKPGDPLEFEILVKNVSKEEIPLLALNGRLAHYNWRFHFGDWEWSSPGPSLKGMRLKPGDTGSVRCLVATTRDSLTAEQKSLFFAGPFRNVNTGETSTRLPEGVYRVRAALPRSRDTSVETNVIEVRISDHDS